MSQVNCSGGDEIKITTSNEKAVLIAMNEAAKMVCVSTMPSFTNLIKVWCVVS